MTDWNVGSGARNDLFVEALQMANGHIGFGTYRALHHDGDEVDLLESGDVNNEVEDEASLLNFDSFSEEAEIEALATDTTYPGAEFFDEDAHNEAVEATEMALIDKYYHDLDNPYFNYQWDNWGPHCTANIVRSELLEITTKTSACRHIAEAGKHPQFYSGVRIRCRKEH